MYVCTSSHAHVFDVFWLTFSCKFYESIKTSKKKREHVSTYTCLYTVSLAAVQSLVLKFFHTVHLFSFYITNSQVFVSMKTINSNKDMIKNKRERERKKYSN